MLSDWLERTYLKLPILCRVRFQTLSQSNNRQLLVACTLWPPHLGCVFALPCVDRTCSRWASGTCRRTARPSSRSRTWPSWSSTATTSVSECPAPWRRGHRSRRWTPRRSRRWRPSRWKRAEETCRSRLPWRCRSTSAPSPARLTVSVSRYFYQLIYSSYTISLGFSLHDVFLWIYPRLVQDLKTTLHQKLVFTDRQILDQILHFSLKFLC